jgi:hypothetical protein
MTIIVHADLFLLWTMLFIFYNVFLFVLVIESYLFVILSFQDILTWFYVLRFLLLCILSYMSSVKKTFR